MYLTRTSMNLSARVIFLLWVYFAIASHNMRTSAEETQLRLIYRSTILGSGAINLQHVRPKEMRILINLAVVVVSSPIREDPICDLYFPDPDTAKMMEGLIRRLDTPRVGGDRAPEADPGQEGVTESLFSTCRAYLDLALDDVPRSDGTVTSALAALENAKAIDLGQIDDGILRGFARALRGDLALYLGQECVPERSSDLLPRALMDFEGLASDEGVPEFMRLQGAGFAAYALMALGRNAEAASQWRKIVHDYRNLKDFEMYKTACAYSELEFK